MRTAAVEALVYLGIFIGLVSFSTFVPQLCQLCHLWPAAAADPLGWDKPGLEDEPSARAVPPTPPYPVPPPISLAWWSWGLYALGALGWWLWWRAHVRAIRRIPPAPPPKAPFMAGP